MEHAPSTYVCERHKLQCLCNMKTHPTNQPWKTNGWGGKIVMRIMIIEKVWFNGWWKIHYTTEMLQLEEMRFVSSRSYFFRDSFRLPMRDWQRYWGLLRKNEFNLYENMKLLNEKKKWFEKPVRGLRINWCKIVNWYLFCCFVQWNRLSLSKNHSIYNL